MPKGSKPEFQFDLTGGQLALDLANTVSRRDDPERRKDHLESYNDVLSFLRQSKTLSSRQASELREYALQFPTEARRTFEKVIALRETVYGLFAAIAQRKAVAGADLGAVNASAIEALQHRALTRQNERYGWEWQWDANDLIDRVLWPLAQAAADLLTSDELPLVRFCEASDCQWLFLDHSRNRSRRWCDMTSCGNRAKARRHYERTHE